MSDAILNFWLQHAPVLSVLLPSFTGMALLLLADFGGMSGVRGGHNRAAIVWARRLSMAVRSVIAAISVTRRSTSSSGTPRFLNGNARLSCTVIVS